MTVPVVDWSLIRARVAELWEAREAPHHSIVGQTRCGKSYLMANGLLPLCPWDRVLIIDVKGFDKTLQNVGKPVREIPRFMRSQRQIMRDGDRGAHWYRLVTYDDWDRAREQVARALGRVWSDGEWIVVNDELRGITDVRAPGLNLYPEWERMMLRGGSKGIPLINLTQEPRWVRGSFYTQWSFAWFSRLEDDASMKRLAEVGAQKDLIDILRGIPKRTWLYMDNLDDEPFRALTRVT